MIVDIKQSKFNKSFINELAWSALCDSILAESSLKDLKKYMSIAAELEVKKRESIGESIFLQVSHLVDISNLTVLSRRFHKRVKRFYEHS